MGAAFTTPIAFFFISLLKEINDCDGKHADCHQAGKNTCHYLYEERFGVHYVYSFSLFRVLEIFRNAIGNVFLSRLSSDRHLGINN